MNKILESIKPIVDQSKEVRINKSKLDDFCVKFKPEKIRHWIEDSPINVSFPDVQDKLNFIFVFHSINFSYWGDPKWTVEYQGEKYDGTWGMIASFKKAVENEFPILDGKYLANLTEEDLMEILQGNVQIPLFEERLSILRENGSILSKKYNNYFGNVLEGANGDTLRLVDEIITNFPSFNDFAIYEGQKVFFHKRAQLVVGDSYHILKEAGLSNLKNIEQLTACADYKIPQILRSIGVLEYSPKLSEKVDRKICILAGSKEEIEIRANMIWAVELIKNKLKIKILDVTATDIGSYLWLQTKKAAFLKDKPHHLTRTIFY